MRRTDAFFKAVFQAGATEIAAVLGKNNYQYDHESGAKFIGAG